MATVTNIFAPQTGPIPLSQLDQNFVDCCVAANALSEIQALGLQATARSNLGLGTMATQAANNVAITGGTISGVAFSGSSTNLTGITITSSNIIGGALSGVAITGSSTSLTGVAITSSNIVGGTLSGVSITGSSTTITGGVVISGITLSGSSTNLTGVTITSSIMAGGAISGVSITGTSTTVSGPNFTGVTISSSNLVGLGNTITAAAINSATSIGGSLTNTLIGSGTLSGTFLGAQGTANNFTGPGIPTNQNLIQNGDMYVDQASEGAAVTITSAAGQIRIVDRWRSVFAASTSGAGNPTIQQQTPSSGAPSQFAKSIIVTASGTPGTTTPAAYNFVIFQVIEGSDIADLGLGTATAQTVTLSMYVKSSISSAIYPFAIRNSANNRSYIGTISIPSSATWTLISSTFILDVTGTWLSGLGQSGMNLSINLAGGSAIQGIAGWQAGNLTAISGNTFFPNTASATFEITGVKLERGSTATPFWSEPAAVTLNKLRRYYRKTFQPGTAPAQNVGSVVGCVTVKNPIALGDPSEWVPFEPIMYAAPTVVTYNPSAGNANWRDITAGADVTVSVDPASTKGVNGILIATSGTVTTLGDILAIHYTADAGI